MTTVLDYQLVINLAGEVMVTALPIGIVFVLIEKLVNMFLSLASGERKVRL